MTDARVGDTRPINPRFVSSFRSIRPRPRVLLLTPPSDGQSTLRRLISANYEVAICEDIESLTGSILEHPETIAIVTDLWDGRGQPAAPAVNRIRTAFPHIPIVVCCRLVPGASAQILAMARAGINALALRGFDDVGSALTSLIASARVDCDANRILSALQPFLRSSEASIVRYCVAHADRKMSVGDVAKAVCLSRRTLSHRLATGRLHSAHSLIVWCRLLIAARLLQDRGRTVESIALSLQFGSAAAFRNMLRRRAGISPAQLRGMGGQPFLLRAYTRLLASRRVSTKPTGLESCSRRSDRRKLTLRAGVRVSAK
jgi:AraC-like DNA-binding protein